MTATRLKRTLALALLLLATAAAAQTKTQVFIFAGQSNAGGYGRFNQLPLASSDAPGTVYSPPTLASFPMLYNEAADTSLVFNCWGHYESEYPRVSDCSIINSSTGYGPEFTFLTKYKAAHPGVPLAAVKFAVGGTSIEQWIPPLTQYSVDPSLYAMIAQAKARMEAAGVQYEWAGLIWMHGENGATKSWDYTNPTPGQEYKDKLRTFIANVRAATRADLPVVIGRISNSMEADRIIDPLVRGTDTKALLLATVEYRRAQQVTVAGDPHNTWWDNDDLPPLIDLQNPEWSYHFTSAGYLGMGERAYTAYATLTSAPAVTGVQWGNVALGNVATQ